MKQPRPMIPVAPVACLPPALAPAPRAALLLTALLLAGLPADPPAPRADPKAGQRRQAVAQHARPADHRFLTAHDTINGDRIADPLVIARIERIAAGVPPQLLSGQPRGANVRYLAHAFGGTDDAAISYGIFQEPAAALAFGCALDDHLVDRCGIAALTMEHAAYENPPGVHCQPIRLALGAPAYEPDRCEADAS